MAPVLGCLVSCKKEEPLRRPRPARAALVGDGHKVQCWARSESGHQRETLPGHSAQTGRLAISVVGPTPFRLPVEAQWEAFFGHQVPEPATWSLLNPCRQVSWSETHCPASTTR